MQLIATTTLLKHRDLRVLAQAVDKTIRTQDNRKAYFQRKLQQTNH